jgi:ATP adenylyltransferase
MESFSYNMAMTTSAMVLLPRVADAISLGSGRGDVSLNGTILAGTLMVREKQQWDYLKSNPMALQDVIRRVGIHEGV